MLRTLSAAALTALCLLPHASAADHPTADLLAELIRIDTSNPPGGEARIAEFLAARFRPLGFEIDIIPTPETGKAHFIARLRGDGTKRPLLLAAHADVVGVERDKWTVDPFAGVVKDGYVWGRGAIDFKGGIAVFTQAVLQLARNHVPLHRDVILLVEADEEAAPYNTNWLAKSHWDKMDCEFALNEGGWIVKRPDGKVRYVSISTADKSGVNLVLNAKGASTHSSLPRPDSAIFVLGKALAKLAAYDTQPTLTPSTKEFFLTLAKTSQPPESTYFENLVNATDPKLVHQADEWISRDPLLHAVMRNTVAPVFLNAGFRGNVIPGSAQATLNLRTIPGTPVAELIEEIRRVIDDPRVEVAQPSPTARDTALQASSPRASANLKTSSKDTDLYRALAASSHAVWPEAAVTTFLFQAGTDAMAWRGSGVDVYGIYPYPITTDELARMHGNDERVPVDSLDQGTDLIYRTLVEVASR